MAHANEPKHSLDERNRGGDEQKERAGSEQRKELDCAVLRGEKRRHTAGQPMRFVRHNLGLPPLDFRSPLAHVSPTER